MENSSKDKKTATGPKKKREPGKRCAVMFCNNTNKDGVSLHQFPTDEPFRRQWIAFVLGKRTDDWTPGSGNIRELKNHDDDFVDDDRK